MLIIPAIDIKDGKCVMLTQGDDKRVTIYSDDPVSVAVSFETTGAKRLHIVDLDATFGVGSNLKLLLRIKESVSIPLQVGGGIRNIERIQNLLESGFNYVIVGTIAIKSPDILKIAVERYPRHLIVACDVYDSKIAINGWREVTDIAVVDFLRRLKDLGVMEVLVTDIARDGMLSGPNLKLLEQLSCIDGIGIIVSGGIRDTNDVLALKNLSSKNLRGVVIGKALYEGKLNLKEVLEVVN